MAIVSNTLLTFSAIGNREDLSDMIYRIDPTDTPFMSGAAKEKASAVLHEWQTDTLAAASSNAQLEGDDVVLSSNISSSPVTTRVSNRCRPLGQLFKRWKIDFPILFLNALLPVWR